MKHIYEALEEINEAKKNIDTAYKTDMKGNHVLDEDTPNKMREPEEEVEFKSNGEVVFWTE